MKIGVETKQAAAKDAEEKALMKTAGFLECFVSLQISVTPVRRYLIVYMSFCWFSDPRHRYRRRRNSNFSMAIRYVFPLLLFMIWLIICFDNYFTQCSWEVSGKALLQL